MSRGAAVQTPRPPVECSSELGPTFRLAPLGLFLWEIEGTRAQLQAEGLVPAGVVWLASGFDSQSWTAHSTRFELRRVRPDGAKGPRALFASVDLWCLRGSPLRSMSYEDVIDRRKRRQLIAQAWELSPEGKQETNLRIARAIAAREDAAFQRFITQVAARPPRSRSRRMPCAAPDVGGVSEG